MAAYFVGKILILNCQFVLCRITNNKTNKFFCFRPLAFSEFSAKSCFQKWSLEVWGWFFTTALYTSLWNLFLESKLEKFENFLHFVLARTIKVQSLYKRPKNFIKLLLGLVGCSQWITKKDCNLFIVIFQIILQHHQKCLEKLLKKMIFFTRLLLPLEINWSVFALPSIITKATFYKPSVKF